MSVQSLFYVVNVATTGMSEYNLVDFFTTPTNALNTFIHGSETFI